ncbi:MAG TPA: acyltransferase [Flavobacterium sp.]|nr:acyltransferase [Flavobacterium sp.]
MMETNNSDRIFGLDLMRAAAIVMVVLSHCLWIFPAQSGIISQLASLLVFFGVEIFFVLSGFLIGRILYRLWMKDDFAVSSVMYFLKRRWFRTLPNYFLILVVNVAMAIWIGYPIENGWKYLVFLQNFASPMPAFFPESWSLSVEEFAYVFLPVALLCFGLLLRQSVKKVFFPIVVFLLVLLSVCAKIIYHYNTENTTLGQWNVSLKAVVIYRFDSIFIGVLFAWISIVFADFWKKARLLFAIFGMFLLIFFTAGVGFLRLLIDSHPFFWNVMYLPMASVSIAFFLPILSGWKTAYSAIKKPVTFISLISYSIYLLHYSVILQTMKQIVTTQNPIYLLAFVVTYLSVTILLSWLLYRFYEKPMTDKRDKANPTA